LETIKHQKKVDYQINKYLQIKSPFASLGSPPSEGVGGRKKNKQNEKSSISI